MQKRIDVSADKIVGATSGQTENIVITVTEQDVDPSINFTSAERTRKFFPSRKALKVEQVNEGDKTRVVITVHGNSILELYQDSLKLDGTAWGASADEIVEQINSILQA